MDQATRSTATLRPFTVTVIDRNRRRTRYTSVARNWHEAWLSAANQFGLVALISVRPVKPIH